LTMPLLVVHRRPASRIDVLWYAGADG
jgi:hypothetical protein